MAYDLSDCNENTDIVEGINILVGADIYHKFVSVPTALGELRVITSKLGGFLSGKLS